MVNDNGAVVRVVGVPESRGKPRLACAYASHGYGKLGSWVMGAHMSTQIGTGNQSPSSQGPNKRD